MCSLNLMKERSLSKNGFKNKSCLEKTYLVPMGFVPCFFVRRMIFSVVNTNNRDCYEVQIFALPIIGLPRLVGKAKSFLMIAKTKFVHMKSRSEYYKYFPYQYTNTMGSSSSCCNTVNDDVPEELQPCCNIRGNRCMCL